MSQNDSTSELKDLQDQVKEIQQKINSLEQTFDNIVSNDWSGDYSGSSYKISDEINSYREVLTCIQGQIDALKQKK
jgi:prefoldin subunit 5